MRRQRRRGKKWETELWTPKWGKEDRGYCRHQSRVFPAACGKDHSEADRHYAAWAGPCWSWHSPRRKYIPQKVRVGAGEKCKGKERVRSCCGLNHCHPPLCTAQSLSVSQGKNEGMKWDLGEGREKVLFWCLTLFLSTQIYFTCQ